MPEDRKKAAAARSWLQSREGPARAATGLVGLLRRCDAALVVARRLQSANDQGSLGRSGAESGASGGLHMTSAPIAVMIVLTGALDSPLSV